MEPGPSPSFMDWVKITGRFIASQMPYSNYTLTVRNPFEKTRQAFAGFNPSKLEHWGIAAEMIGGNTKYQLGQMGESAFGSLAGSLNGLGVQLSFGLYSRSAEDIGLNGTAVDSYNVSSSIWSSAPGPFTMVGTGGTPSLAVARSTGISLDVAKPFITALNMPSLRFANSADDAEGSEQHPKIEISPENQIDRSLSNAPTKRGGAPTFKSDNTSVEIHHEGQNPYGPWIEKYWFDHRGAGNDMINHPNKSTQSQIDRKTFNRAKRNYWIEQFFKKENK